MYSPRIFQLLLAALSVVSAAEALRVEPPVPMKYPANGLVKRQLTTRPPPQATTTTPPPDTTTSPRPTTTPPTTPPTTTAPPPTSTTPPSPTTTPPATTAPPPTTSVPPPETSTFIVLTTAADGSPTSFTSQSVSTPTPTLSNQGGGGTTTMSDTTRNTIIGVVVGVGGAIILAVIALVAWRIWGRKKRVEDNDDGMVSYGGGYSAPAEKVEPTGSASGRTPFQSTLESYHAPTQVNASSNF